MTKVDRIMEIVRADRIDFDALEQALDDATHPERVEATRMWDKPIQRRIFEQAEGRKVTLDQLVPGKGPLQPVHHWGKNTVAPGLVDQFQKRFARLPGRDDILAGYNESWYRWAVCPGYYVAYEDADTGEVVVDYTRLPDQKPDEWPRIVPNWSRLGIAVFYGMTDRLRRVSDHVTQGRAYKGKPMNQYFVLTRED